MKLLISDSAGMSVEEYYTPYVVARVNPTLREPVERIKKLLSYLERNIEGPPLWVTVSHLVLLRLSEEDDWRPENAQIFIELAREGYKIKYRSSRDLHYWDSFTTLEAKDEVEAGHMIVEALRLAERNLPTRDELSFHTPT
jgi:hypothetical protein